MVIMCIGRQGAVVIFDGYPRAEISAWLNAESWQFWLALALHAWMSPRGRWLEICFTDKT